jgi:Protein of unknown function (DUF1566)
MKRRITVVVSVAAMIVGGILTGAVAAPGQDPFSRILEKLDELLTAVGDSDLQGVTQNWDKALPANDPGGPCPSSSSRFTCVLGEAAVRDNQTGLVWEQAPTAEKFTWNLGTSSDGHLSSAREACFFRRTGGQRGWRLPSLHELMSLYDTSHSVNDLALPIGHPFTNIKFSEFDAYWSATTTADNVNTAWIVSFREFGEGLVPFTGKEVRANIWCVRGGNNADRY